MARAGGRSTAAVISRILAAVVGGYALAALTSVAALALPLSRVEAVLTGTQLSFLVYAAAVVWVFAARSAWRAWGGLIAVAVPLATAAAWGMRFGGR